MTWWVLRLMKHALVRQWIDAVRAEEDLMRWADDGGPQP